jgi:hypothetical protein
LVKRARRAMGNFIIDGDDDDTELVAGKVV